MGDLDRDAYMRHRYRGDQRLVHRRELRAVVRLLSSIGPLGRVLDAPSGHGRFCATLQAISEQLVALDNDLRHLRALRAAEPSPPGCVVADALSVLPFSEGAFDLAFCFRFLHHVRGEDERRWLLGELARVSGRYVLISYYQAVSLHGLQRAVRRALRPRRTPLALVGRAEMRAAYAAAGLKVLEDAAILPGVHAQRIVLLEREG